MQVNRMASVVSRLLGTVCRSGGGHLIRAHWSWHVRVLRIPGDMSAGRWWGYFPDVMVARFLSPQTDVRGHTDVCARGHDPRGADAQVQRAQGGLSESRERRA